MDKVRCGTCGGEHDLSEMEPSYTYPDAYLALPPEERRARATVGTDSCRLRDASDVGARYFLRVLLPIPVRGETDALAWGVWAEVSEAAYARTHELWDDPAQRDEPPFEATLANALTCYAATLGLPGAVTLSGPTVVPTFVLAHELDHPLAREQRDGVQPERVVEWLFAHLH
jgi:hypothetical protein